MNPKERHVRATAEVMRDLTDFMACFHCIFLWPRDVLAQKPLSVGWPGTASSFSPSFSKSFSLCLSMLHFATVPFLLQTPTPSGNVQGADIRRGKHPAWQLPLS